MKLKNKKTGEIVDLVEIVMIDDTSYEFYLRLSDNEGRTFKVGFNSLADLNAEWEDYEEPKDFYYINENGGVCKYVTSDPDGEDLTYMSYQKQIGNYFSSREEAEKAVKKLKAWKRLKDKGFKLNAVVDNFFCLDIYMKGEPYEAIEDDLKIVFGGEE